MLYSLNKSTFRQNIQLGKQLRGKALSLNRTARETQTCHVNSMLAHGEVSFLFPFYSVASTYTFMVMVPELFAYHADFIFSPPSALCLYWTSIVLM